MDATFFASQTESGQTRLPLVASDSMRLTLFAPVPPINTDANHPALPREKHRVQAQLSTTSSDLLRSTSISSKMPPFSHPSALHPNDPTTSSIPLTSINAATSSSAPAHKPFSSTALASTSIPGSPAPGAIDDPGLQANLLNILLSSASGRQRILDVLTPQVNTQLVPDLVPQPLISQQFQPSPAGINSVTPHPLQDTNPSSYHPDAQNQITLSPQLSIDGGPNSLWNMLGACGAGPQLDPSFTNMDTASRASSLAQSNAQLQRTFQSAADVDNRINTLQSYLGGYAPDSGVQDESMPLHSEFDASNFFGPFGVGELDTHLDAQLGDAFNLGPENADEFSSMPTSHLGTYVDEAGSASPTSSPKVPSIIWNNPVIVGEVDSDWAMGVAG
ncbi:hypothetical protein BOTBODRAFT_465173 [Botryobasidium botryosum FD-172 SS1]|uniref:Uncharacterized protein n=1 Tax=Botryobasidium botryosum (strain FD-172 SS1) TaxID=930990 RepID=A0A067MGQ5_BOTB1|nr:hypothetical protein BOTBODRAFT_465173 [Botryobasidium botryosum FD-172 SS1]